MGWDTRRIHATQVGPSFVVARQISVGETKSLTIDLECTVIADHPFFLRARKFQKPAHVCTFVRDFSRAPQRCGARREGKHGVTERLFDDAVALSSHTHAL